MSGSPDQSILVDGSVPAPSTRTPSAMGQLLGQVRWEQIAYWRNPLAAGFTFAFPLIFLVVFIAIYGNTTIDLPEGTMRFAQYYVPAIIAFGIITTSYTNLAFSITHRREAGLLKRSRGTPLRPAVYLGGIVGNAILVGVILVTLVTVLGVVAYGVTFPGRYLGFVVNSVVGTFCFASLGFMISTFIPNEDAAPAIINFILFPLLFISGTFAAVSETSTLGRIAAIFPVRHITDLMVEVFNPYGSGTGIVARNIAVLLAWGLGALAVAVRRFRWEPPR